MRGLSAHCLVPNASEFKWYPEFVLSEFFPSLAEQRNWLKLSKHFKVVQLTFDFLGVSNRIPWRDKNAVYRWQISAFVLEILQAFKIGEVWNPACCLGNKIVKLAVSGAHLVAESCCQMKHFWCKLIQIYFFIIFDRLTGWRHHFANLHILKT